MNKWFESLIGPARRHNLRGVVWCSARTGRSVRPPKQGAQTTNNCWFDTHAKHHNNTLESPQTQVPLPTPAQCQLHIGKHTITQSFATTLHFAYSKTTSLSHIATCLQLLAHTAHTIAWKEFTQAFQSFPLGQQYIIGQWLYGFLPTQRRLF